MIASLAHIHTVVYLSREFQGKGSEECTVACGAGGLTLFCRPVRSRSRPPWPSAPCCKPWRGTLLAGGGVGVDLCILPPLLRPPSTILRWCCWSGTWSRVERAHTRMHARSSSSSTCRCPAHHASGGPLPPVAAQLQPLPRHIGSQPRGVRAPDARAVLDARSPVWWSLGCCAG